MHELINCTDEDKRMFSEIHKMVSDIHRGHSDIQIKEFILNEIEYPTPYGKFMQVKLELTSRYSRLVDAHYDIKELEVKIKMKERDVANSEGLERELNEVQLERMQVELAGRKSAFEGLLDETRRFYSIYQSMPEFHSLPHDEIYRLELQQWQEKAKNMPLEFEKRYGEGFLRRALGSEYEAYKTLRARVVGILPHEFCKVALIEGGN